MTSQCTIASQTGRIPIMTFISNPTPILKNELTEDTYLTLLRVCPAIDMLQDQFYALLVGNIVAGDTSKGVAARAAVFISKIRDAQSAARAAISVADVMQEGNEQLEALSMAAEYAATWAQQAMAMKPTAVTSQETLFSMQEAANKFAKEFAMKKVLLETKMQLRGLEIDDVYVQHLEENGPQELVCQLLYGFADSSLLCGQGTSEGGEKGG